MDLTLDRIRALASHLQAYTRPTCHVTGTNGKGSVSILLESILVASSLSVGRFNSPHLIRPHDCISINGKAVDESIYQATQSTIKSTNDQYAIGATSFEILTLTALLIFENALTDIVIVEVGMGGRLDATNVIPDSAILVSAMTAVDLDHTAFLGTTVREIATEKAGIARAGKILVVGKQRWAEVIRAAKGVAGLNGAELLLVEEQTVVLRDWDVGTDGARPPTFSLTHGPSPQPVQISCDCFPRPIHTLLHLHGEHQLSNLGVAVTVISVILNHPSCASLSKRDMITPQSVANGIQSAFWPGRLSWHTLSLPSHRRLNVLVDGAHNVASAESLTAYITGLLSTTSPFAITYILALSKSPQKMPKDTLRPLLSVASDVCVALVEFSSVVGMPWVKCCDLSELGDAVKEVRPGAEMWIPEKHLSVNEQLLAALEWAASQGPGRLVVLAGSLYLVSDFYRLGLVQPPAA